MKHGLIKVQRFLKLSPSGRHMRDPGDNSNKDFSDGNNQKASDFENQNCSVSGRAMANKVRSRNFEIGIYRNRKLLISPNR